MKSAQDKGTRLEEEIFKFNRLQEENVGLKKKLDKAKRMEYLGASDEILVEEVKMYKVRKSILLLLLLLWFSLSGLWLSVLSGVSHEWSAQEDEGIRLIFLLVCGMFFKRNCSNLKVTKA